MEGLGTSLPDVFRVQALLSTVGMADAGLGGNVAFRTKGLGFGFGFQGLGFSANPHPKPTCNQQP